MNADVVIHDIVRKPTYTHAGHPKLAMADQPKHMCFLDISRDTVYNPWWFLKIEDPKPGIIHDQRERILR